MKLSKLTYHNGAVKVEVYQKGQERRRWNTGVRVDKKFLTKDRFIKPNEFVEWQTLNVKISEEKERVDRIVRQVYKERQYVDVLRVFQILSAQEEALKASSIAARNRSQINNGSVKKKLNLAIRDFQSAVVLSTKKPKGVKYRKRWELIPEEEVKDKDAKRKVKFFNELNLYLYKEAEVTSEITIARHFVTYLAEGTSIGFNNLKRHQRIFDFMINHPVMIDDVSDVWVRKLLDWLETGVRGTKINSNTTDWLFGRFQCFWTWALNSNIVTKRLHWKRFKRATFKPGFVWLTEKRLIQLAKVKFTEGDLECARKAYLIMCLTALRHSDFHSLKPDHVIVEDGKSYIHKANKKTQTVFKTEVHELILQWVKDENILKKMKFSPNSYRSNQLLNESIRDVGYALGWNEPVRIQVDADKWDTKPFYEWMNCHSGRHTAVCLWLSHAVSQTAIKKWTGWKGSKMIDYYADILNIKTKESINQLVKF